ncbi:uncharacterized protein LOC130724931 [Lotus japonicus]|uniref:uncharacterized protein LOC130724931 n=1 Tax=Lotus japonicus TaxID=34305 RepID=UPI0025838E78|nr:uncharacterized protein LOC130724931 [Lotus japonicus]
MVTRSGANGERNHIPQDNVPPDVLQRIMDDLNDLRQHNQELQNQLNDLNQTQGQREGDQGMAETVDHLVYFNTKMVIVGASDALKCKMLPSTFKKSAMIWFTTLPSRSIVNFTKLSAKFLSQFSTSRAQKMPKICIAAFELGLRPGSLNNNLSRKPVETMAQLRVRVQGFIREEQSDQVKKNRPNAAVTGQQQQFEAKRGAVTDQRSRGLTERGDEGYNNRNRYDNRYDNRSNFKHRAQPFGTRGYGHSMMWTWNQNDRATPLAINLTEALHTCLEANVIRFPRQPKQPTGHVDKTKWCEYHRISGHNIDDCFTLRKEIEKLIKAGCMKQLEGRNNSDEAETSTKRNDEGKEIESEGQNKHWAINQPDITFTVRDFERVQPHEDDPIVVMLRIVEYEIERVLLDQGSSADFIYGDAFEKLGLTESDLLPYDVKCTSLYNVLIGRPSLNRLGAIISTRHLTTKYPLSKGGVGVLKVDQVVAKKCYSESFKQYGHLGKKVVKEGHRVYEVNMNQDEASLDPRDGFLDHKMTSEEETKVVAIGE